MVLSNLRTLAAMLQEELKYRQELTPAEIVVSLS
jgi:hypothetical protein